MHIYVAIFKGCLDIVSSNEARQIGFMYTIRFHVIAFPNLPGAYANTKMWKTYVFLPGA